MDTRQRQQPTPSLRGVVARRALWWALGAAAVLVAAWWTGSPAIGGVLALVVLVGAAVLARRTSQRATREAIRRRLHEVCGPRPAGSASPRGVWDARRQPQPTA